MPCQPQVGLPGQSKEGKHAMNLMHGKRPETLLDRITHTLQWEAFHHCPAMKERSLILS